MWHALPCPGAGLPVLPGNPALGALREFRVRLLGCLTAWGDALLELAADAALCPDRPVRSLVQLSLGPEFRRGHGALYDALAAGRVGDERLFSLLTEVLPPRPGVSPVHDRPCAGSGPERALTPR